MRASRLLSVMHVETLLPAIHDPLPAIHDLLPDIQDLLPAIQDLPVEALLGRFTECIVSNCVGAMSSDNGLGCSTYICMCVLLACDFNQEPVHALSLLCVSLCILGCAFLTFVHRESAEKAMEQLHGKRVLPGVRVWCFICMRLVQMAKKPLLLCVRSDRLCAVEDHSIMLILSSLCLSAPLACLFLWTFSSSASLLYTVDCHKITNLNKSDIWLASCVMITIHHTHKII